MTRALTVAVVALVALVLSAGVALGANAGALDPTFHEDGRRTFGYQTMEAAQEVLVQPDGKIILAGDAPGTRDFTLSRLNPDGSPDKSFGQDGTAVADFGADDRAYAAAFQADGKILVAGATDANLGYDHSAVARFTTQGELDGTFDPGGADGDGKKIFDPSVQIQANAVLVQPDGLIVLAGNGGASSRDFSLVRLNPGGSLDGTSFEAVDFGGDEYAEAAALQPDGKIVLAGSTSYGDGQTAVARYNATGSLDKTFDGTGKHLAGGTRGARGLLLQPDGKIVLAGSDDSDFLVARLNPGGTPDTEFGDGGTAVADFDSTDLATSAVLQPDGKIVLAGVTLFERDFAVARFDARGVLDPSFGSGGKATVNFGGVDVAWAMALQPDGRLVLAGQTDIAAAVARLQADPPPQPDGGPAQGGSGSPPPVARCAGRAATIVGTAGPDRLRGTPRADVIVALGGNDRVAAGRGRDIVCGGRGNDRLAGGPGADRLLGERGRDLLVGGTKRDTCVGGPARDRAAQCERRRTL
jgi:uncharacterized delta-60 repeat protein